MYPSPKVAEIPDMEWLNVEKFPAELSVELTRSLRFMTSTSVCLICLTLESAEEDR